MGVANRFFFELVERDSGYGGLGLLELGHHCRSKYK